MKSWRYLTRLQSTTSAKLVTTSTCHLKTILKKSKQRKNLTYCLLMDKKIWLSVMLCRTQQKRVRHPRCLPQRAEFLSFILRHSVLRQLRKPTRAREQRQTRALLRHYRWILLTTSTKTKSTTICRWTLNSFKSLTANILGPKILLKFVKTVK